MQKKNPKDPAIFRGHTRRRTISASYRAQSPSLSEPFRHKLPNGITVVGESVPTVESVAVGVWVNFGSRDEKRDENGLTHLIEHMVFKGTRSFSAEEIVGTIEGRGGYINAFTTKESSCYYAKVFREEVEQTLSVLSELVLYPTFKEPDLRNERKVVLSEMQEVYDDPEDWGMDYIEEKIFGANSLSMSIIGKSSTLRSFSAHDLAIFHKRNFTADRIVVAAAGNFSESGLLDLVSKYFSPMPKSTRVYIRTKPHQDKPHDYIVRRDAGKQVHILLGAPAPGLNDKERFAASMVGVILGDGSSSRLYKDVREKSALAYSVYSYGSGYADTGVIGIYACTGLRDYQRAEDQIYQTIGDFVKTGPTTEEVVRAKAQLKAGIIFSLENLWDRASIFARDELYYKERSNIAESLDTIEKVTSGEIMDAAANYLTRDKVTSLKILPVNRETRSVVRSRSKAKRRSRN